MTDTGRSWHDMGGLPAGPVNRAEHDVALWEKRIDALVILATAKGLMTVDGLRRALEDLGPNAFETMSYYERWAASLARNLIEAGAITPAELGAKIAEIEARGDSYAAASAPG